MSDRCEYEHTCGFEYCNGRECPDFKEESRKEMMKRIIKCEGFQAFRGTMKIKPKAKVPSFELTGDWLFKPDTGLWYGKGSSFSPEICTIVEVQ